MNLYLSGLTTLKNDLKNVDLKKINALESFVSISKTFAEYIPSFKNFLLDSGAFTFMRRRNSNMDFDMYAEKYAEFVKMNNIKLYFELDIDSIVGLDKVEGLRNRIENIVGYKCIPVWHKSRGREYFIDMCKEYDYVAIGGIATKELPISLYERLFPWFIMMAHENKTKIHGLGYSFIDGLKKYDFDSVDSTTWLSAKYGKLYQYYFGRMKYMEGRKNCQRIKNTMDGHIHNLKEWVKFSEYTERYL